MKTKIHLPMMFVLISAFVLVSACSKSSDDGTTADSSSTSASTVSATIEVYDGGSSTSRSLDRSVGFSSSSSRSTGNIFSDINKITVSVKEGQITHIDNQTLSKDSSDGRWKATLLNLPTSVTLTFSGDAYGSDNTTKTFSGTVSTSLSTSGTNIIGLTMYPVSNNTTQTFPTITSVLRPSSMNVGDNASIQIAVKGSTNETLNYFFGSGGGTFNPGQCTSLETSDNDNMTMGICNSGSVDFTLSGTTGTIVSTYTAPTVIPSSGKVEHTINVSNSQNNAVEVGFSITLTNSGASGSGTYSLEPRFAPVITGLSGRRGGTITDNGSSQLYVTWTANVNMVKNSDDNGSSNSNSVYWKANWAMSDNSSDNGTSICHPNSFNTSSQSCSSDWYYNNTQSSSSSSGSSPRTFAISLPARMSYSPDNTTGTLSLSITQGNGSSLSGGITTKIYYQIPLGLFPNNVIQ